MPRGDKSKYTGKQKRQAEHIEDSYKEKGVSTKERRSGLGPPSIGPLAAERKSGSGKGKGENKATSGRGGENSSSRNSKSTGAKTKSSRTKSDRSAAAKKGWETRRKKEATKK